MRYWGDWVVWALAALAVVVIFGFTFGLAWFAASQEAASYRKFCDTPVTTWDALWLDLRIDECARGERSR